MMTRSDLTDNPALTVTFTKTGYMTNSGATPDSSPNPWPASGTWKVKGDPKVDTGFTITREDGLDITVALTETSLNLRFTFDDDTHKTGGRNEAVDGAWVMGFTAP